MLVSLKHQFAFFSNPKCATTSIENYLKDHCEISINSTKYGKHIRPENFAGLRSFLRDQCNVTSLKTICTDRNPVDKLISWYTYRSRPRLKIKNSSRYLGDTDFRDFCRARMQKFPLKFYYNMQKSSYEVDFVVPLEHLYLLEAFFQRKFKTNDEFPRRNISRPKNSEEVLRYKEIALEETKNASSEFSLGIEMYNSILDFYNNSEKNRIVRIGKIF